MRIAIDAVGNVSGGGLAVLYRTVEELSSDDRVDALVVYGSPADELAERIPAVDGFTWVPRRAEHRSIRARLQWYAEGLQQTASRFGANVVIAMNGMGSTALPRIAVVQQAFALTGDLSLVDPWSFRLRQRIVRDRTIRAVQSADHVVVGSDWLADASQERLVRRPTVLPLGLPRSMERAAQEPPRHVLIDVRPFDYKRAGVARTVGEIAQARVPELIVSELDGTVPAAEVRGMYETAVAFVSASRVESLGLGLLEAFAHGCPVVAPQRPWSRSAGVDAPLFFAPDDASGAAEHVVMLATDPVLRAETARRGRARLTELWDTDPYRALVDLCAEIAR